MIPQAVIGTGEDNLPAPGTNQIAVFADFR